MITKVKIDGNVIDIDTDTVQKTIDDLVSDFLYYDRKEDEELPREAIQQLIANGILTEEQLVNWFRKSVHDQAMNDPIEDAPLTQPVSELDLLDLGEVLEKLRQSKEANEAEIVSLKEQVVYGFLENEVEIARLKEWNAETVGKNVCQINELSRTIAKQLEFEAFVQRFGDYRKAFESAAS